MWIWFARALCILAPPLGFFLAILLWLFKKGDLADQILFFSFIGIFVFIVVLVPLVLILRFVVFAAV